MPLQPKPPLMEETVYQKLLRHRAPPAISNELLAACEAASDEAAMVKAFDEICEKHRLRGPPVSLRASEVLGHVKPQRALVNRLASVLDQEPSDVERHLLGLAGVGSANAKSDAHVWFAEEIVAAKGNPELSLARRPTWLFRNDDKAMPFTQDPECIPWRLGLPDCGTVNISAGGSIACFGFRLDRDAVDPTYVPTALDCSYAWVQKYWEPGGKTNPLENSPETCIRKGGLREVVAEPVHFGFVNRPLVSFESAI